MAKPFESSALRKSIMLSRRLKGRLFFLYTLSALWLKPFESSALGERTTTKTELMLGLFLWFSYYVVICLFWCFENFVYICDD